MAESKPTLTYFHLHGKNEPIRMLLAKAGVDYNDVRINFEQFAEIKATGKFPVDQVPIWEENGRLMNQSYAILRYLGRKHGFYFETDQEQAFVQDWVLSTAQDWWDTKAYRVWLEDGATEEQVAESVEKFAIFNKQIAGKLAERGDSAKFIAGDRLSIADLVAFSLYMTFPYNEGNQKPAVALAA